MTIEDAQVGIENAVRRRPVLGGIALVVFGLFVFVLGVWQLGANLFPVYGEWAFRRPPLGPFLAGNANLRLNSGSISTGVGLALVGSILTLLGRGILTRRP